MDLEQISKLSTKRWLQLGLKEGQKDKIAAWIRKYLKKQPVIDLT